ncbi:hypothetical protein [Paenibacillus sp. OK060]|uniref:hypothetical protein n=1 Tax=Paenibacillus sp. OK060 TaxID=1881034 RepID=UPI0015A13070|nr:hypothetical protein [Paenibacillus sp. OK060]
MPNSKRSSGDEIDSGEAARSPESFLQESCIGSIRYHRISTLQKAIRKSGDNSDRKNDS